MIFPPLTRFCGSASFFFFLLGLVANADEKNESRGMTVEQFFSEGKTYLERFSEGSEVASKKVHLLEDEFLKAGGKLNASDRHIRNLREIREINSSEVRVNPGQSFGVPKGTRLQPVPQPGQIKGELVRQNDQQIAAAAKAREKSAIELSNVKVRYLEACREYAGFYSAISLLSIRPDLLQKRFNATSFTILPDGRVSLTYEFAHADELRDWFNNGQPIQLAEGATLNRGGLIHNAKFIGQAEIEVDVDAQTLPGNLNVYAGGISIRVDVSKRETGTTLQTKAPNTTKPIKTQSNAKSSKNSASRSQNAKEPERYLAPRSLGLTAEVTNSIIVTRDGPTGIATLNGREVARGVIDLINIEPFPELQCVVGSGEIVKVKRVTIRGFVDPNWLTSSSSTSEAVRVQPAVNVGTKPLDDEDRKKTIFKDWAALRGAALKNASRLPKTEADAYMRQVDQDLVKSLTAKYKITHAELDEIEAYGAKRNWW